MNSLPHSLPQESFPPSSLVLTTSEVSWVLQQFLEHNVRVHKRRSMQDLARWASYVKGKKEKEKERKKTLSCCVWSESRGGGGQGRDGRGSTRWTNQTNATTNSLVIIISGHLDLAQTVWGSVVGNSGSGERRDGPSHAQGDWSMHFLPIVEAQP